MGYIRLSTPDHSHFEEGYDRSDSRTVWVLKGTCFPYCRLIQDLVDFSLQFCML